MSLRTQRRGVFAVADDSDKPRRKAAPRNLVKARRAAQHGAALLDVVVSHRLQRNGATEPAPAPPTASPTEAVPTPTQSAQAAPKPAKEAPKRPNRLVRIKRVTMDAIEHFINDEALMTASALAFTLILALFPFLIFIAAVASLLGGQELAATISAGLFDVLPEDIARALQPQVREVIGTRSSGFLTFGLLVTIFSLTTAIESIRAGLNRAYGVKEMRNIVITRIESLLFVLVGSLTLLIVALLAVVAPLSYEWLETFFPDLVPWRIVYDLVRLLLLAVVLYGALVALHVALPSHRRGPKQVWIGCVVTLVLWYIAGLGFSFYLANFGNYAATYAGLAGVVAALMFFYLCAVCLLFGGEVNRAIAVSRRRQALERRGLAVSP